METVNVVMTQPFPEPLMEKLAQVSSLLNITTRKAQKAEDLADVIAETDVLYTFQALPEPEAAPRLRWVQLHSAGADGVLQHPLYTHSEVMFTTTSGIHAIQMAEYVLSVMLAFAHRLPHLFEDQTAGVWTNSRWKRFVPDELYGATVGIVGYGSIGRQVAHLAQAFGLRVLALKRDVRRLDNGHYSQPGIGDPQADIPDRIYPNDALRSFVKECDYVIVTVPLTGKTRHLIDASVLEAMKPTAILINIARGDVVDEEALIGALLADKIGGAGLDVYSQEPLPTASALWQLPNVILSPHIAGFSEHYDERATDVFAENLRRFLAGEPLLNLVDREHDY
jgi:phosphoglycerate dehydrogenase-like enzyme